MATTRGSPSSREPASPLSSTCSTHSTPARHHTACFVFQNFGRVWEIAGVHTEPGHRRRGLGACVVGAALRHLLAAGALPRYQTSATNDASLALARSIGLVEFLRIEHLEIAPSAA